MKTELDFLFHYIYYVQFQINNTKYSWQMNYDIIISVRLILRWWNIQANKWVDIKENVLKVAPHLPAVFLSYVYISVVSRQMC